MVWWVGVLGAVLAVLLILFAAGFVSGWMSRRAPLIGLPLATAALCLVHRANVACLPAGHSCGKMSPELLFLTLLGCWWWPTLAAMSGWMAGIVARYGRLGLAALVAGLAVGTVATFRTDQRPLGLFLNVLMEGVPYQAAAAFTLVVYLALQGGRCRLWEGVVGLIALVPAPWLWPVAFVAGRVAGRDWRISPAVIGET